MTNSADWWARKMRGEKAPAPVTTGPRPRVPVNTPPVPQQATSTAPVAPTSLCPECRSANYMVSRGNSTPRCFNCGYVPGRDIRNSTQGLVASGGETAPAPGQQPGSYQPGTIVGKVE